MAADIAAVTEAAADGIGKQRDAAPFSHRGACSERAKRKKSFWRFGTFFFRKRFQDLSEATTESEAIKS